MSAPSFESKADDAGKALKEKMGLASKEVRVNGDGREASLPPEGSYARMAMEQQAKSAPPAPTATNAQQKPEAAAEDTQDDPPEPAQEEQISQRAKERIEELARRRREEEQKRAEAEAEAARLRLELETERAKRGSVESEYQRFLNESLDQMDPDQRASVLAEARLKQALDEQERRILEKVQRPLQEVREAEFQRELGRVGKKYPGYNHDIHSESIRDFMQRNPSTTPEQAFRAIANDDELFLRSAEQQGAPAFVQPRGTKGEQNRPQVTEDPNEKLRERTRDVHRMARSDDPEVKRAHQRALDQLIKDRLGM